MNFRHTSRSTNDLNQGALTQSEKIHNHRTNHTTKTTLSSSGGGGWKPLSNLSLTDLFNRNNNNNKVESAEEPHHNEGWGFSEGGRQQQQPSWPCDLSTSVLSTSCKSNDPILFPDDDEQKDDDEENNIDTSSSTDRASSAMDNFLSLAGIDREQQQLMLQQQERQQSVRPGVESFVQLNDVSDTARQGAPTDDNKVASSSSAAMDNFLSMAGINKDQQSKLGSMRLQQSIQKNNYTMGGGNSTTTATNPLLDNATSISILSRMVTVQEKKGGNSTNDGADSSGNNMPIRVASMQDFSRSRNTLRSSQNSSSALLRRNSVSRSSLGSVPENKTTAQEQQHGQVVTSHTLNQAYNNLDLNRQLLQRREHTNNNSLSSGGSGLSRPSTQPNLGSVNTNNVGNVIKNNEDWTNATEKKKQQQQDELDRDIFQRLSAMRLQKQMVLEKSSRWSQQSPTTDAMDKKMNKRSITSPSLGSMNKSITSSLVMIEGVKNNNEEWSSSSLLDRSDGSSNSNSKHAIAMADFTKSSIDELIELKLKVANQQATIDTLSSQLTNANNEMKKNKVASQATIDKLTDELQQRKDEQLCNKTSRHHSSTTTSLSSSKDLEMENASLTSQLNECRQNELRLIKEIKAQQADHEREMKIMEEKNTMLRNALDEELKKKDKSGSRESTTRYRGSEATEMTKSTVAESQEEEDDDDDDDETDYAFRSSLTHLDDSDRNKSFGWY